MTNAELTRAALGASTVLMRKRAFQSISNWSEAHPVTSLAAGFVPGVGTALYGNNAISSFRQGKILSGIGNTIGAGMSMIPGGGAVAKGVGAAAKGVGSAMSKAFPTVIKNLKPAVGTFGGAAKIPPPLPAAAGAMPPVISPLKQAIKANPKKTQLAGAGAAMGAFAGQDALDAGKTLSNTQSLGISNMLTGLRDRMPGVNPITLSPN